MQLRVKELIKQAPEVSGVYRFINDQGVVLYVGKAKNLRKRLHNYLSNNLAPDKYYMVLKAASVAWYITENQEQALFLEAELIEHLKPMYNIQYRYGKNYAYLGFSKHAFPRLFYQKRWNEDSYGPFDSWNDAKQILENICYAFKLRTCSDNVFKVRKRPCLEYDIGRCSAPCVGYIDEKEYAKNVKGFKSLFAKGDDKLLKKWSKELEEATLKEEYELANVLYQRISGMENLKKIVPAELEIDYADLFISCIEKEKCIFVLCIREQKLRHKVCLMASLDESIESVVIRWYVRNKMPPKIFVNEPISDDFIEAFAHKGVVIDVYRFLYPNINNIVREAESTGSQVIAEDMKKMDQMARFAKELGLEKLNTVEVYDNSHMSGKWNVGVKIVWTHDGFQRRSYKVWKYEKQTNDDYEMMRMMFKARFAEKDKWPDLVIIDGGAGQLSVSTGFIPVPHFALSKHDEGDKLHGVNGLVEISQECLLWLMRIRDEAHRFAVAEHTKEKLLTLEG